MSLLSRGKLRELTPFNWVADGHDSWPCYACEKIVTDDSKVSTRRIATRSTIKEVLVCDDCIEEFDLDNE